MEDTAVRVDQISIYFAEYGRNNAMTSRMT